VLVREQSVLLAAAGALWLATAHIRAYHHHFTVSAHCHSLTLPFRRMQGIFYKRAGDFDKAKPLYERSLLIRSRWAPCS
jgi:hypothetical protein